MHLDAVGGQEAGSRNWNGGQGKKVIEIVQTYFSQRRAITFRPALPPGQLVFKRAHQA